MSAVTLGALPLDGVDAEGVEWVVEDIEGWDGSPGSTIQVVQRPRAHGAWAGDAYLPARSVAVGGVLMAPDRGAARRALQRLNEAASLASTTLAVNDAGESLWAGVRRQDVILAKWLGDKAVRYSVQLVATDPRRFGDALVESTALPSTAGGLTVPLTVPFTINAVTVTGQVSLTNPGNIAGTVRLRIDGPVQGPVVTHVNSGRSLVFSSSIVLGAGEWIDVDMERREVLANGQASRNGWVTARGWSAFEPGENTWAFTAAGYDPGSKLTVTATPAWQ
ncbi:phage distal tail protein [Cellulomonas shaoxiangyii]|uniref:Siphovirus-type tail component C-terminal domain-containing protein n=1 Tax=Cellulomonas shaoxiangyii TaxID=2566013 RepID=A0A4V1CMK8_9CELL|nr:phage tail family protein [Cellulomonas shaoxiangyii]QCB93295.1 hypothetical protein E5225_06770 [Cellulomonas shaoxiangyii]TGY82486.1 hypothetical protein E5226_13180 [Cellulomonas shaoxiangyii]